MDGIVTFHVVRERRGRQLVVMARMLVDRWHLRRVDGLDVARVLGTGRGDDTGPSVDLLRQAYMLVWRDTAAARSFLDGHPIARRWRSLDVEHDLALGLVAGHGSWSRQRVLDGLRRVEHGDAEPVVVLTRARIRMRSWRAFRRASRETAPARPVGRCWALGVGELPVGLLGTMSCWRSTADLDAWLTADGTHAAAAAHAGDWFAESLFARFAPIRVR
ncbi:MAG: hypothetical protein ACLGHQ_11400 [Acidimicrobiia bacterium]